MHTRVGTIALAYLAETGNTGIRYDDTEAQRIIAALRSSSPIYVRTVIKDDAIPLLLRQQHQATFVTINETNFWQKVRSKAAPF